MAVVELAAVVDVRQAVPLGGALERHHDDVDFGEPVARNYEALIEICYTYQIKSGWTLQPDFQYIFQPGGNVAGQSDAAVVGARTSFSF